MNLSAPILLPPRIKAQVAPAIPVNPGLPAKEKRLDALSGDISDMVFRRIISIDIGQFPVDGHMLAALVEMDGKQTVRKIMEKSGLDMAALREVISRLLQLKLIEPTNIGQPILDREFHDLLKTQLCLAVGPISEILIEDAVNTLGQDYARFPKYLAAELVDLLAKEIRRKDKGIAFKQFMIRVIKDKGYYHPNPGD